ncbi:MAG: patatin family protein [Clostridia bacterium]|nr:patatin family protein [Clostridia bacterium]
MKKGLVMEGGAMRGLFTAGILDVLMEEGITTDGAIGVSAGAAFGCNFKSGQIGRALRYNKEYCRDKRYCSFHSLITTGDLYGAEFCYKTLPEELDLFDNEAYESNPMEFYVVCTDVVTGQPVYKKCDSFRGNNLEWIRASASLPLVSRVVEIEGYKLLDGGISDAIPLKHFESLGYEKNLVILTQPEGYVKKKNSINGVFKVVLKNYPKLQLAMERRHIMYNEELSYVDEREEKGAALVLRPKEALPVKRTSKNPELLQKTYDLGRELAKEKLSEIKAFLCNKKNECR